MYAFMNTANVYPAQKKDKSHQAVQHGFVKTLIHLTILILAIIIMSVYYSQLTETKRETIQVDRTKNDWIPYETYKNIREDYGHDSIISCDCSRTQIDWDTITSSVDIIDDYVCNAVLAAYNYCYFETVCLNGKVGKIILWYLWELCDSAHSLYPRGKPQFSLTSGKVYTDDELHSIAVQLSINWQAQITQPFQTTFIMTYPLINNKTEFFYDWAVTTRFEDLENATYWNDVWGLENSSYGIASVFSDVFYDELGYLTVADAIEAAFISHMNINYRYTNTSTTMAKYVYEYGHWGYYQTCAPHQCAMFTTQKKSFIEIFVIIFGLLGGVHASLFVIVGIGHTIYRKIFKIKFESEQEEKIQMTAHQETSIITAKDSDL